MKDFFNRLEKLNNRAVYFLFFVICLALYFKCLTNGYSLDDDYALSDKSVKNGIAGIKEIFGSHYIRFHNTNYEYRPLTKFVFAIEYQLFGLKAGMAHFISILFYFFTSLSFFNLLMKLRFIPGKAFALLATFIFILHPLHTEVVCSIKNLDVLLSTFFSLLACNYALKSLSGKKILFLGLSMISLVCGLLSKLDALAFFAIIPALVYLQDKKKVKFVLTILVIVTVTLIFFIVMKKVMLSDSGPAVGRKMSYYENPLVLLKSFRFKAMAVFSCFGFYIEKLVTGFPLVCYYGFKTVSMDEPFSQEYIYIGVISFLLFILFLWKKRKDTLFVFSVLMFAAPISMYLNFPKIAPGIVADRFAFVAVSGFSLLFSYFIFAGMKLRSSSLFRRSFISLLAAVLFFYAASTIKRTFDWRGYLSLVEKDIEKVPGSVSMNFLYGNYLLEESKSESGNKKSDLIKRSIIFFKKGIVAFPGEAGAWNTLGTIYLFQLNDYESAYRIFKTAYKLGGADNTEIFYAKSMFFTGRRKEFCDFLKKEINNDSKPPVKEKLIQFVSEFPQFLSADSLVKTYMEIAQSGVTNADMLAAVGKQLSSMGKSKESIDVYFIAIKNGFRDKRLEEQMAEYFYENGQNEKASYLMDLVEGKRK